MGNDEFTIKEVVIDIKRELAAFRSKYDEDQEKRDDQISKRPTRTELALAVAALGTFLGIAATLLGA